MQLDQVPVGRTVVVRSVHPPTLRSQALRLGIGVGARLEVVRRLKGGPVVVRSPAGQLAVGKELAQGIEVEAYND
ncbi:MAG: ferrous iron transport protein A [Firmicutes bacterium]|nr:ferrous iron transport protein A [Bacillota bacterium]